MAQSPLEYDPKFKQLRKIAKLLEIQVELEQKKLEIEPVKGKLDSEYNRRCPYFLPYDASRASIKLTSDLAADVYDVFDKALLTTPIHPDNKIDLGRPVYFIDGRINE